MRCRTHLLSVELIVLMEVRLKCGLRCEEHALNKNELSTWKMEGTLGNKGGHGHYTVAWASPMTVQLTAVFTSAIWSRLDSQVSRCSCHSKRLVCLLHFQTTDSGQQNLSCAWWSIARSRARSAKCKAASHTQL